MSTQVIIKSNMKLNISIKWQLMIICIILVTIPAIIMGVLSYQTYKTEVHKQSVEDLSDIVCDWQTMTKVYLEEMYRVLKREEVLVEQRLSSVALDVKQMISFFDENSRMGWNPAAWTISSGV